MTDLERAGVSDDIEEKWGCVGVGEEGMECEGEVDEGEERRRRRRERIVKKKRVWDDARVLLEKEDDSVAKRRRVSDDHEVRR